MNAQIAKRAIERDHEKRAYYLTHMVQNFQAEQLVFVDETGVDKRTIWRNHGYAKKGTRAVMYTDFARNKK